MAVHAIKNSGGGMLWRLKLWIGSLRLASLALCRWTLSHFGIGDGASLWLWFQTSMDFVVKTKGKIKYKMYNFFKFIWTSVSVWVDELPAWSSLLAESVATSEDICALSTDCCSFLGLLICDYLVLIILVSGYLLLFGFWFWIFYDFFGSLMFWMVLNCLFVDYWW